jgi:hypothetical protein
LKFCLLVANHQGFRIGPKDWDACCRWLDEHPDKATPERLLLMYAWNENGEGGYLTPTAADDTEYLEAVERAITAEH